MVFAVVPAAGSGRRFGGDLPKQYLQIGSRTVMQWTLDLLTGFSAIREVVVAVAADDTRARSLSYRHPAKLRFVTGGAERMDSVLAGLEALPAEADDWVLVHDVARPCVPESDILRLMTEVQSETVGGILAQPVRDTLKQSAPDGRHIAVTVPREGMWQAQTPQMFRHGLLRHALQRAAAEGIAVTDEASALEYLGYCPLLVPGSPRNLKITWPEDLILASHLLSHA